MSCYARKLLSVGIPLSHTLCFLNLPLYATLQRSCSCSESSMSMELFPMHLTSLLTEYLHLLGSFSEDRGPGLPVYSPVLGVVGRSHMLCLFLDNICHCPALVALLCNLYTCADFLCTYCGESNMSANPGIVPLLYRPLTEVSLPGLSHVISVV